MYAISRKPISKWVMLVLSFMLAFSSLLLSFSSVHAELGEMPSEAPQNVRVVDGSITHNSVDLEWDFNEEYYELDVWDADTDEWLANINNWNTTVKGFEAEKSYRIYLTWWERPAKDPADRNKSNIVEFTTIAGEDEPSIPPKNLRIVEGSLKATSVTIEWDFIPDDNNDIDIWNADTGAWITWGNIQTRTFSVEPETEYRIYITWHKDRPSHDYRSEILEFTTPALDPNDFPEPPLTPPHHLHISKLSESEIQLSWTGSPGANGYDVYVNGGWAGGVWDDSNTFTYQVSEDITVGDVLKFEVGAQLSEPDQPLKVSENSNAVTLIWGMLAAPADVKVITANKSTATLGWAPSPGALSYEVYQDGELIDVVDSNRYLAKGLTEGETYSFNVVAKNDLWVSPPSQEVTVQPGQQYSIVTYYTSWSIYDRQFNPEDVDVSQITYINYAFSDLCWFGTSTSGNPCQNENVPLQKDYVFNGEMILGDAEADLKNFKQFAEIRDRHPHLQVLVSVGGWTWSKYFSDMAMTEETRRAFANSVVDFLREYRLDGIDIDWEYPVEGGLESNSRSPKDKENFTLLMKTVREALDAAGAEDRKYYLLTIASGQGDNFVINADLANSVHYLDFINIMTYDYSGSWDLIPFHNSPLYYDEENPVENAPRFHVQGGVNGHLTGGVPNYKLNLGIPFYGKGWRGCPPNGQYQLCEGATNFGTWEAGIFDYTDIEENYINKNGYVRYWNDAAKVPYLYNSEEKIYMSYNDQESMKHIAQFVKELDLAGVMIWEISGDRNKTLITQLSTDLPIGDTTPIEIPDWSKEAVGIALSKKWISKDQLKGINDSITRAEFVSIFAKALGLTPARIEDSPFKDVNEHTAFAGDIIAAVQAGIIEGKSKDEFDPAGLITRQEMATIIANAMEYAGYSGEADLSLLDKYSDRSHISSFAEAPLALMIENQIIIGVSESKLAPLSNATKAQAIVTANRMIQSLEQAE